MKPHVSVDDYVDNDIGMISSLTMTFLVTMIIKMTMAMLSRIAVTGLMIMIDGNCIDAAIDSNNNDSFICGCDEC